MKKNGGEDRRERRKAGRRVESREQIRESVLSPERW